MKRFLFFAVMLALSVLGMAQQPKKVAVWETKCSDNSITPFQSIMVRGGMETAVANAPGYTGYDRAAFDAIVKEQNFQRSGAVSDSEIRRLGIMAGVQYIIVPEASASGNDFYIIIKMLDVETGEYGTAYDALCTVSASDIKQTCVQLGTKLFGGNDRSIQTQDRENIVYVDLGLPSGTLWSNITENGLYSQGEAIEKYGNDLPTMTELQELYDYCKWQVFGNQYKVTGPNGNSILLPARGNGTTQDVYRIGEYGCYWSSTIQSGDGENGLGFYISDNYVFSWHFENLRTMSVRLVKRGTSPSSSTRVNGYGSSARRQNYTETAFGINMHMIYVDGGSFDMGCTSEQNDCDEDEKNVRRVRVDGYYIGMLEVTQNQWCKVMGMTESELWDYFGGRVWEDMKYQSIYYIVGDTNWDPDGSLTKEGLYSGATIGDTVYAPVWGGDNITRFGSNYPVYAVDYGGAIEFCRRLSEQTGKKYTLPTEAQWEYAARGGNKSKGSSYAGGNAITEVAWYKNNSNNIVQTAGTRHSNELGIYDMSGNIAEWCKDCYVGSYLNYDTDNPGSITEEDDCHRVVRGGSFTSDASQCRVSARSYCWEAVMYPFNVGFRVVCIP